jgi:hypothetical protein
MYFGKNEIMHNFQIDEEDLDKYLDQLEDSSIEKFKMVFFPGIAIRKDQFIGITWERVSVDKSRSEPQ